MGILIKSDLFERAKFKKVFIMKCFLHVLLDFCSALSCFMEYGVQVSRTVNPISRSNFVIVNAHFIKAICLFCDFLRGYFAKMGAMDANRKLTGIIQFAQFCVN